MGNTSAETIRLRNPSVHPHACGEHYDKGGDHRPYPGSSPRLWGTRPPYRRCFEKSRFIPTPVGNTFVRFSGEPGHAVHPHACGEHHCDFGAPNGAIGSSPRLWGTLALLVLSFWSSRFIPTPVGNTGVNPASAKVSPVHPHACGEHRRRIKGGELVNGSSPRLWGTPFNTQRNRGRIRFIPTPVGNTVVKRPAGGKKPVHPHACGEH